MLWFVASKTNPELVLEVLRSSSRAMDDDQLSDRSGVKPRQAVNRICRDLERSGVIRRYVGPDRKIVNELREGAFPAPATIGIAQPSPADPDDANLVPVGDEEGASLPLGGIGPSAAPGVGPDPRRSEVFLRSTDPPGEDSAPYPAKDSSAGSSREQRAAESIMLAALAQTLGLALSPRRLLHSSGARVELDGADPDLRVLVECWAHQGPAKVAQKYKLMNDAVKLHWIARSLTPAPEQLILCVSDEAAVRHLRGKSWQGQAVADLGVEIYVVALPAEVVSSVSEAQKRQYR